MNENANGQAGLRQRMIAVLDSEAMASRILAQAIEQLPLDGKARVRADVIMPSFEARLRAAPELRRECLAVVRCLLDLISTDEAGVAAQRLQAVLDQPKKSDVDVNKSLDRTADRA